MYATVAFLGVSLIFRRVSLRVHSLQRNPAWCLDILVLSWNVAEQGLLRVNSSTKVPDIDISKNHCSRGPAFG